MDGNLNENNEAMLVEDEMAETQNTEKKAPSGLDPNGKTEIVGVRFKKNGKTYYFAPNGFTPAHDEAVIVDTSRGQEFGYVALTNREIKNTELSDPLRSVIRIATAADKKTFEENAKKEIDAYNTCIGLIDKHRLEMKLVDTELCFDRSKMLFYFSAEGRVDFRELVKDLAGTFHTRIEMRQIGIRDEAKILGGLGICGRPYCCSTFLNDFGQVSVKMAKEQNLSLNTAKISGSCGRLMCCLRYEYETYLAEKALTPKVDAKVMTPNGLGTVVAANPLAGIVKVRIDAQGEDSEPVVFVREDVVEADKYDGQKLTKTEIPKRGKKNDDIPSFAEFAAPTQKLDAVAPKASESAPAPVKVQQNAPEKQTDQVAQQTGEENKHKKHRHKKHKKNGNQQNQNQPQNPSGQQNGQSGQPNAPRPQGTQGQQGGQNTPDGAANKKKKKRFFHHHGKGGGKPSSNSPKAQ